MRLIVLLAPFVNGENEASQEWEWLLISVLGCGSGFWRRIRGWTQVPPRWAACVCKTWDRTVWVQADIGRWNIIKMKMKVWICHWGPFGTHGKGLEQGRILPADRWSLDPIVWHRRPLVIWTVKPLPSSWYLSPVCPLLAPLVLWPFCSIFLLFLLSLS